MLIVLQLHIPAMNKKASNSENSFQAKPQTGKTGIEGDNNKKEHLLDHNGDIEPPQEGKVDLYLQETKPLVQ